MPVPQGAKCETIKPNTALPPAVRPPMNLIIPAGNRNSHLCHGVILGSDARFGLVESSVLRSVVREGPQRDLPLTMLEDHSESIRIEYDPTRVSYETLLDIFWKTTRQERSFSRQYCFIFYHNEAQREAAMASARGGSEDQRREKKKGFTKKREEGGRGGPARDFARL